MADRCAFGSAYRVVFQAADCVGLFYFFAGGTRSAYCVCIYFQRPKMDAHAAVRTFYGFFHNDRNICNLMLDDFDGGFCDTCEEYEAQIPVHVFQCREEAFCRLNDTFLQGICACNAVSIKLCSRSDDLCCDRGTDSRDVVRYTFQCRGADVCIWTCIR